MTMALDLAPATRRGMTLGIFTLGMLFGNAAGTPLGGSLSKLNFAYPFWLGTALLLIISTIVFFFVRDPAPQTRAHSFRRALAALQDQPRLIIPYAFTFLDRLTVGFFITTFLLLVKEVYNFDAAQAGAYLASSSASSPSSRPSAASSPTASVAPSQCSSAQPSMASHSSS